MKIQTTAIITKFSVDGESISLKDDKTIDLEFSAIDTGGGFKDPILDFSFSVEDANFPGSEEKKNKTIMMTLLDPQNPDNKVTFSCEINDARPDKQINARLKEDELSRELIGFVLQLLR